MTPAQLQTWMDKEGYTIATLASELGKSHQTRLIKTQVRGGHYEMQGA